MRPGFISSQAEKAFTKERGILGDPGLGLDTPGLRPLTLDLSLDGSEG